METERKEKRERRDKTKQANLVATEAEVTKPARDLESEMSEIGKVIALQRIDL